MELIKIVMTQDQIESYNENTKNLIKEMPDIFNESWLIESVNDLFIPYSEVVKEGLIDIPDDGRYDLTKGIYVSWVGKLDYTDTKLRDNNEYFIEENFHLVNYGVADNATQIINYINKMESNENIDLGKIIILIDVITKSSQPAEGGWRWHKNGEYIGVLNPQYEYLADEDSSINTVLSFNIYCIE